MNVKAWIVALLLLPQLAWAQGFAGLGSTAEGFALPQRGTDFSFPADHSAHPDYRIEWWYLTATLTGADGRDYGVQFTLFRSALAPETASGWSDPQIWFAHAAATTETGHYHAERLARGGIGQAGVTPAPFDAWIDDWHMTGTAGSGIDQLHLRAGGSEFSYDLRLEADTPLIFHGEGGYSVKSPEGQASYYYSQPNYRVSGTLSLPSGPVQVTGNGWLDREWSSQPLSADQRGWDWVSLAFDDGYRMMAFRLRGAEAPFHSGSWIAPDGTTRPIAADEVTMTPVRQARVAGRDVPVGWRISYPRENVDLSVEAVNDHAWNDTNVSYWEGPVRITGSHSGRGYLEMTGYDP